MNVVFVNEDFTDKPFTVSDQVFNVPPRHVLFQLDDGSFQVKKKRGRPLGSKNKPKVQNVG